MLFRSRSGKLGGARQKARCAYLGTSKGEWGCPAKPRKWTLFSTYRDFSAQTSSKRHEPALWSVTCDWTLLSEVVTSKGPQLVTGCGHFFFILPVCWKLDLHITRVPERKTPPGGWPGHLPLRPTTPRAACLTAGDLFAKWLFSEQCPLTSGEFAWPTRISSLSSQPS